jgi:hypothetical protein
MTARTLQTPSAEVVEARWQQSLALFELWTQIWAEQPSIADRSGVCVQELMSTIETVQRRYADVWSAQP